MPTQSSPKPRRRTGKRHRLTRLILRRFPSPVRDISGEVWSGELAIVMRLLLGQSLVCDREHIDGRRDGGHYAVSWYWAFEPKGRPERWYPASYDAPVMRLLGRQIIRPVGCFGGYTEMHLTDRARRVFAALGIMPTATPDQRPALAA